MADTSAANASPASISHYPSRDQGPQSNLSLDSDRMPQRARQLRTPVNFVQIVPAGMTYDWSAASRLRHESRV